MHRPDTREGRRDSGVVVGWSTGVTVLYGVRGESRFDRVHVD